MCGCMSRIPVVYCGPVASLDVFCAHHNSSRRTTLFLNIILLYNRVVRRDRQVREVRLVCFVCVQESTGEGGFHTACTQHRYCTCTVADIQELLLTYAVADCSLAVSLLFSCDTFYTHLCWIFIPAAVRFCVCALLFSRDTVYIHLRWLFILRRRNGYRPHMQGYICTRWKTHQICNPHNDSHMF